MNKKHFFFWLAMFAVTITLFLACEKVIDISLNKNELTLVSGETETLIATIYPNDATNKKVKWTSSNPAVATVNDNGLVTAIASGKATITATTQNGKKTATCSATVDYRAKWVGKYKCEKIKTNPGLPTLIATPILTVALDGDSLVWFLEEENSSHCINLRAKVDSDGGFTSDYQSFQYPAIRGNFYTDSLHLYFYIGSGSWGTIYNYEGKKLKNVKQ